jgi:DNA-binding NarL/FixJ family response regulator
MVCVTNSRDVSRNGESYTEASREWRGSEGSMTQRPPIKVLCVDDHPLVRDGISFAVGMQPDMVLVSTASNGQEAIAMFGEYRPDVTLMDIQLPDIDGFDVMSRIRARYPHARFIVLTTYGGDVQAARALKAGAMGYLLKSMLRKELIDTIHAVHSGQRRVSADIASSLSEFISADALTARELQVIRSVACGNANKCVAASLGISEDTVKCHMKNILIKLGAKDRTHAVVIAMRRGFLDG